MSRRFEGLLARCVLRMGQDGACVCREWARANRRRFGRELALLPAMSSAGEISLSRSWCAVVVCVVGQTIFGWTGAWRSRTVQFVSMIRVAARIIGRTTIPPGARRGVRRLG